MEEIKQWRSSLEKITLEEFAARLGKVINEEKETRDIVDIVLEKDPLLVHENYKVKTEKITSIAQKAISKEREITTVRAEMKAVNAIKEAGGEVVFYKEYPGYPHGIWDIAFEEVGLFDQLLEYRLSDRYDIEVEDVADESDVTEDVDDSGKVTDNTQLYIYIGVGAAVVIIIAIVLVIVLKKKK